MPEEQAREKISLATILNKIYTMVTPDNKEDKAKDETPNVSTEGAPDPNSPATEEVEVREMSAEEAFADAKRRANCY